MIIKRRKHSFRIPEHGEVSISDSRLTSGLRHTDERELSALYR